MTERTILVVGAGFSGTMVATHLLRSGAGALRVVLIDRSAALWRGVAYGTSWPGHLLNVPAGRMSAFPDDDDHFLRFASECSVAVTGGSFLPRMLYARYLEHVLRDAEREGSARGHRLEQVSDGVVGVSTGSDGRWHLRLASGDTAEGAHVVLALGNHPPSNPRPADGRDDFFQSPRYVRDPWAPGILERVDPSHGVLLVGTGLTMLDVALRLAEAGGDAPIVALSRRGLLPLPHRAHGAPPSYGHLPPGLIACEPSAPAYLRAMRRHARALERDGVDWREIMASLRPVTPRLWETLPPAERARFLRHARAHWDTHRHRVSADVWQRFEALRSAGRLSVVAGRVLSYDDDGAGVTVRLRTRGAADPRALQVGVVVNCTGPEADVRRIADPLVASLIDSGVARPDELGLGFDTDDRLTVIGRDGSATPNLWLTGPLLKGRLWESTAVPELRVHAARVAKGVLQAMRV